MATISISRALTKQKTLLNKVKRLSEQIRNYGALTSKDLSLLSTEKDIAKNHVEAKEKIAAMQQSIHDCIKFYIAISVAVNASNLESKIVTPIGEMSVAEALILYRKVQEPLSYYNSSLNGLAATAENKAQRANKDLRTTNLANGIDANTYAALEAKPVVLVPMEEVTKVDNTMLFIISELNLLVNEHNAMTFIDIPDGLESVV